MHRCAIACTLLLLLVTHACTPECVEEACGDANRSQAHGALAQGIVGVVAYRTDACANDCCECSYVDATLHIYETQSAEESEADAQMRFISVEPTIVLQARERYAQALEPGRYAVCDQQLPPLQQKALPPTHEVSEAHAWAGFHHAVFGAGCRGRLG